jgi:hypothetical protein
LAVVSDGGFEPTQRMSFVAETTMRRGVLLALLLTKAVSAQPLEFKYDFRTSRLPPELSTYHGEEGDCLHLEREGMRIKIPKTFRHEFGGVGFRLNFDIGGDFDITLKSEILELDWPDSGAGVGVGIRIVTAAPASEQIMIARMMRPKQGDSVVWQRATKSMASSCAEKAVRLRLKRTGSILNYSWAPAAGGDFQELKEENIGPGNVSDVRFVAMTNQKPVNLDARFLGVSVRHGGARPNPEVAADNHQTAPAVANRSRLWLFVAIGFFVLLLLIGAVLVRKNRRAEPNQR